jgi:hypothetical protein
VSRRVRRRSKRLVMKKKRSDKTKNQRRLMITSFVQGIAISRPPLILTD